MPKFLTNVDLAKNQLLNAVIQNLGSAPGSPVEGQIYYDTASDSPYVYSNETTSWVPLFANKLSAAIPNSALVNNSVTIGTTSVSLGGTALSLAGLQGLTAAAGAYNFNWSSSTGTFSTSSGANTLNGNVTISGANTFTTGTGAVTINGNVTVAAGKTITMDSGYTPSNDYHVATKIYVDNSLLGIARNAKAQVIVATTANITTLAGGAPSTLDGISLSVNDRVLVKDQSTPAQNGIYYVQTVGTGANGTWVRATDADVWAELVSAYVWVEQGSTQADTGWLCTSDSGGTLGTTAVTFVLFASASSFIAGNGLTKTGNTIDVNVDNSTIEINADTLRVKDGGITYLKLAAMTSANFASVISDETGSGVLVFGTSPSFTTSVLTGSTTFGVFDTTATTINAFGAATTLNLGHDGTTASTTNIATGATASGTKAVNIGTGASAGTTNVTIGATNAGTTTINSPTVTLGAGATVTLGAVTATTTTINFMTGLSNASAKTLNIGTGSSGGALSTVIGGSLTFAGHQTAGFVKTNASGVVSIDTNTYITSQSNDFGNVSIDNTDTEYTWVATDGTTAAADTTADTLKIVAAKTNATYGIQVVADATNDAIGIRHADTSSQASVDNSANSQFLKSITFDEFGHVTAITSGTPAGGISKYSVSIGDNSTTSITVTHNLGTQDVSVEVYEVGSPYEKVYPDIRHTTTNTCTIIFATAPTTNQYRVVVMG